MKERQEHRPEELDGSEARIDVPHFASFNMCRQARRNCGKRGIQNMVKILKGNIRSTKPLREPDCVQFPETAMLEALQEEDQQIFDRLEERPGRFRGNPHERLTTGAAIRHNSRNDAVPVAKIVL